MRCTTHDAKMPWNAATKVVYVRVGTRRSTLHINSCTERNEDWMAFPA